MPSFITRTVVSLTAAAGLTLAAPAAAQAAAADMIDILGSEMREELAERGVQRPHLSDRTLGLIASDICRFNLVRPELDDHLTNPDMAIPQFFLAARAAC